MQRDFDFSRLSPQNVIETSCDLPFARVRVAMMVFTRLVSLIPPSGAEWKQHYGCAGVDES